MTVEIDPALWEFLDEEDTQGNLRLLFRSSMPVAETWRITNEVISDLLPDDIEDTDGPLGCIDEIHGVLPHPGGGRADIEYDDTFHDALQAIASALDRAGWSGKLATSGFGMLQSLGFGFGKRPPNALMLAIFKEGPEVRDRIGLHLANWFSHNFSELYFGHSGVARTYPAELSDLVRLSRLSDPFSNQTIAGVRQDHLAVSMVRNRREDLWVSLGGSASDARSQSAQLGELLVQLSSELAHGAVFPVTESDLPARLLMGAWDIPVDELKSGKRVLVPAPIQLVAANVAEAFNGRQGWSTSTIDGSNAIVQRTDLNFSRAIDPAGSEAEPFTGISLFGSLHEALDLLR